MTIEILSIEDARDAWLNFQHDADLYAFQSYDWLYLWYQYVGRTKGLDAKICIVRCSGDIKAIFPFALQNYWGIRVLTWLGGVVTDYHAPLLSQGFNMDKGEFYRLWHEILKDPLLGSPDIIWFEKQPEFINHKKNPFVFLFKGSIYPFRTNAYHTILNGTWDEYFRAHRKSKHRSDSKRQLSKLSDRGILLFHHIEDTEDIERFIGHLMAQKEKRYKEIGAGNIFKEAPLRDFYKAVIPQLVRKRGAHFSALTIDDEPIALHFGLIDNKRFYYLMPTFNNNWRRYSPGRLLMEHLIEWCFDNSFEIFDFTIGNDDYKMTWADRELRLYQYTEALTLKGVIFKYYNQMIAQMKANKRLRAIISSIRSKL